MALPSGPYAVGFVDVDAFLRGATKARTGVSSLGMRVYYPARVSDVTLVTRARDALSSFWLPTWEYARSLPHYAFSFARPGWRTALTRAVAEVAAGVVAVSQFEDAHPAAPFAVPDPADAGAGAGAALEAPGGAPRPVVVFSHGAAGNRTMYSKLLCDLASHGAVVLALEHQDGTAGVAQVPLWEDAAAQAEARVRAGTEGGQGSAGNGVAASDDPGSEAAGACRPGDAWLDVAPSSRREFQWFEGLGGDEGCWAKQRARTAEFLAAGAVAGALAHGECGEEGAARREVRLRVHGARGLGPLQAMAGRIRGEGLLAAGHSFGGVTAALAAHRGAPFCGAAALDPWWGSLPPEDAAGREPWGKGSAPLMVLASGAWHERAAENPKWGYNRTAMEPFLSACGSPSGPGAFFTAARHVGHIDYGDILIRLWSNPLLRMAAQLSGFRSAEDPATVLRRLAAATRAFLAAQLEGRGLSDATLGQVVAALEGTAVDPRLYAAGAVEEVRAGQRGQVEAAGETAAAANTAG